MTMSASFGWELLVAATKSDIASKQDVIVSYVHWCMVSRGFRCAGIGEDVSPASPSELSELLPIGWNASSRITLRYALLGDTIYLLTVFPDENTIIVNLNRSTDRHASGIQILQDEVLNVKGPVSKMFRNSIELCTKINETLINPFLTDTTQSTGTQTNEPSLGSFSEREYVYDRPYDIQVPYVNPGLRLPPRNVGYADLNPFGSGSGGGMLFDPPGLRRPRRPESDPNLPIGAIPPGARFDPYRPIGIDPRVPPRPRNPDHDHLPPPGYDDMFM